MEPKRVAGVLNIVLAVVAFGIGYARHANFFYVIGVIMLLLAWLRLRRPPTG